MARTSGGKEGVLFGPPERGKDAASRSIPGRLCAVGECPTVLSTYNPSITCWLHSSPSYRHPLTRG
jgi:hypothetical protein